MLCSVQALPPFLHSLPTVTGRSSHATILIFLNKFVKLTDGSQGLFLCCMQFWCIVNYLRTPRAQKPIWGISNLCSNTRSIYNLHFDVFLACAWCKVNTNTIIASPPNPVRWTNGRSFNRSRRRVAWVHSRSKCNVTWRGWYCATFDFNILRRFRGMQWAIC